REIKGAEHISRESSLKLLGRNILERIGRMLLARIVDENVALAEFLHRLLNAALAKGRIGNIAAKPDALLPFGEDMIFRFPRILLFLKIDHGDIRAFLGKGDRDRPADTAVAAADEQGFAFELSGGLVIFHERPRRRG